MIKVVKFENSNFVSGFIKYLKSNNKIILRIAMKQCISGLHRYRKYCKNILHIRKIKGGIPRNTSRNSKF